MTRPKYRDLTPGDFGQQLDPYSHVELKHDGLYSEFIGNAAGWSIHGRNGRLIRYGQRGLPSCYFQGEMVIDTEWAAASEDYGVCVLWNSIYLGDSAPVDYDASRSHLREISAWAYRLEEFGIIKAADSHPVHQARQLWNGVEAGGDEGLIFRSADGQRYGRMKRVVTMDYICMGFKTEGPRFTAVQGGLYIDGRLEHVCTVPIKSPVEQAALYSSYMEGAALSPVFEAKGNAVLASGALRHPRQAGPGGAVKWRADKAAAECRI